VVAELKCASTEVGTDYR